MATFLSICFFLSFRFQQFLLQAFRGQSSWSSGNSHGFYVTVLLVCVWQSFQGTIAAVEQTLSPSLLQSASGIPMDVNFMLIYCSENHRRLHRVPWHACNLTPSQLWEGRIPPAHSAIPLSSTLMSQSSYACRCVSHYWHFAPNPMAALMDVSIFCIPVMRFYLKLKLVQSGPAQAAAPHATH